MLYKNKDSSGRPRGSVSFFLLLVVASEGLVGAHLPDPVGRWPLTPEAEDYYFCQFPDYGPRGNHLVHYTGQWCNFTQEANPDPASVGRLPSTVYYFGCGWEEFLAPPGDRRLLDTDLYDRNITTSWYMYQPLDAEDYDGTIFNFYNESDDDWGYHLHQNADNKSFTFETADVEEHFDVYLYEPDVWNFFTLTYDEYNDKVTLYRNGVFYQQFDDTTENLVTTEFPFEIGRDFQGYLYCLQMYDELLTPEQINMTRDIAENECRLEDEVEQGQVTRMRGARYMVDAKLNNTEYLIESMTTRSIGSCVTLCDSTCACLAVNVKQRSQRAFDCELFRSDPFDDDIEDAVGWKIYQLVAPWCSKRAAFACEP